MCIKQYAKYFFIIFKTLVKEMKICSKNPNPIAHPLLSNDCFQKNSKNQKNLARLVFTCKYSHLI